MTVKDHDDSMQGGINPVHLARTLLRIVAELPESEYSEATSTELSKRQIEVVVHNDLPDPASGHNTPQG